MNTLTVLLQQIGMFVIYIITGVIMIRTKVLTRENLEIISKVVIKLSLPVMIFINTVNGVDRQTFFSSLSILGIAAVMYVCLLILGTLSGKVFRLQGEHLQLYRAMTVFGNVGFMGIPIVVSIYPEKGMLYMAVFTVIDQLMLWTLGVKLTSSEKEGGAFNPKKLINPVTVAIILAIICVLTGIRIPLVLNTALQKMGATATPLAMIYLGGVFACIDVLNFIRKPDYYGITLIKMLVFPVLFLYPVRLCTYSGGYPDDYGADFCHACDVIGGNDGKCFRIGWRLCNGRNCGYYIMFCPDPSCGILDLSGAGVKVLL